MSIFCLKVNRFNFTLRHKMVEFICLLHNSSRAATVGEHGCPAVTMSVNCTIAGHGI